LSALCFIEPSIIHALIRGTIEACYQLARDASSLVGRQLESLIEDVLW
jgi:hypothetical protein